MDDRILVEGQGQFESEGDEEFDGDDYSEDSGENDDLEYDDHVDENVEFAGIGAVETTRGEYWKEECVPEVEVVFSKKKSTILNHKWTLTNTQSHIGQTSEQNLSKGHQKASKDFQDFQDFLLFKSQKIMNTGALFKQGSPNTIDLLF
nr:hypothetical protein Iba_chr07aCG6820 [Ipomoea batatas]